ncbi:hypothetical protein BGX23_010699 [Mortierella sp. AD031]|nr:hypothetical protein BGX23_010699 [Mortierella sp. AD031]
MPAWDDLSNEDYVLFERLDISTGHPRFFTEFDRQRQKTLFQLRQQYQQAQQQRQEQLLRQQQEEEQGLVHDDSETETTPCCTASSPALLSSQESPTLKSCSANALSCPAEEPAGSTVCSATAPLKSCTANESSSPAEESVGSAARSNISMQDKQHRYRVSTTVVRVDDSAPDYMDHDSGPSSCQKRKPNSPPGSPSLAKIAPPSMASPLMKANKPIAIQPATTVPSVSRPSASKASTSQSPYKKPLIFKSFTGRPPGKSSGPTKEAKPYVCPHCDTAFARKYNMHTHAETHDLDSTCDKQFTRKHDLVRHEASFHQGARKYHCPHCDTGFSRPDGLTRHLKKNPACAAEQVKKNLEEPARENH